MTDFIQTALPRGYCPDNLLVVSNGAFFISAYFSYLYLSAYKVKSKSLQILPVLIVLIGIGSAMFHTDQNLITLFFDMAPLYLFILYSIFLILKGLTRKLLIQLALVMALILLLVLTPYFVTVGFLNNSIRYIIILFSGILLSFWINKKYQNLGTNLTLIVSLFGISIIFRSLDQHVCNLFSLGTHSYWHLGVAITSFLVVKLLVNLKDAKPRYYAPKR